MFLIPSGRGAFADIARAWQTAGCACHDYAPMTLTNAHAEEVTSGCRPPELHEYPVSVIDAAWMSDIEHKLPRTLEYTRAPAVWR